jgi:uncharacterized protein with beta-barrel porin domain
MNKNRFLSKKVACLLTSALVASPVFFHSTTAKSADLTIANNATTTVTAAETNNYQILGPAAGTLAIANVGAMTLTGSVTTAVDNIGILTVNDTNASGAAPTVVTITGAVGSTDLILNGINIGVSDATGGHALFLSDVKATTIRVTGGDALEASQANFRGNVNAAIVLTTGAAATVVGAGGTATLTYSGTTGQTQTGAITAAADNNGRISVTNTNSEGVTFTDAIGAANKLTSVTTAANTTVLFSGAVAANTLTIGGSAFLAAANNTSEAVVLGETSKLFTGRNISNGLVAFSDVQTTRPTITAGSQIHISPVITNGQTVVLFDGADTIGDDATTLAEVSAALQNNALFTYAATTDAAANATVVTATARSATATASDLGVNLNKGTAFIQAHAAALANVASDDNAFTNFEQTIQIVGFGNTNGSTADTKFANQVAPQTDVISGSTVAAKAVTSGVQNVISTRLASLRSGDGYSTGVVTGSGMSANSGFIQAFGSTVEQKNKGNEFGYDADTAGFAIGFDAKASDGVVVGISYANSKTDVDGKGIGKAKNDIKTNSGSIYADYATKSGYIEGSLTYGKSDNKASRLVDIVGANRTYSANYDSEQYSFRLFGGVPQSLGGGAFFTPFAGATISQIKADAYTETSTTTDDSLRLRVAQDTVDSQVGTIGIKYHQVIKDGKTTFTPEVKLALNNEFGDGNITTTNTYQGGGASFQNSTAIERTSATAGVGLNISSDNVSFNIGYEADVREKYLGHSAQAKITAKF